MLLRNTRLDGVVTDISIHADQIGAIGPGLTGGPVIDLDGRTVLPGLWDAHVHLTQWALHRGYVDVSSAHSAREAADLAAAGGGPITIGRGFRDGLWPDSPHKHLLDAAAPDRAIVLQSNDLHTAWFSSAALALIGRGDHPDGVLKEQECFAAIAALPQPSAAELDRIAAEALDAAAARGVTGIIDFEFADNIGDWRRRAPQNVRVVATVPRTRLDAAITGGFRTGDAVAGLVTVGPVKIFSDGSLNTRTAYCHHPYPGDGHGRLEIEPAELRQLLQAATRNGIDPAVHAIGDHALSIVLDAFEAVGCRGRIEHAQLVRPSDVDRCAGLVLGVQPAHQPDDRDVADHHWAGHTERAFAYADLLRAGARLEIGSDAPVAPLDPWDGIASAVTRTDDSRPSWHPEQALTVRQAITAAARGRSSIVVGDTADLTIVERDPYAIPPAELRDMPVHATVVAGRIVP
ncbi:MAG TPA: amidohydrolase family protein [Mycobacteriales bacterium]|nr:amidohydrolase family protein [Mycobacteriales bacterium]